MNFSENEIKRIDIGDVIELLETHKKEQMNREMWEFSLAGGDPEEVPEFSRMLGERKAVKKMKLAELTEDEYQTYTGLFNSILKEKR